MKPDDPVTTTFATWASPSVVGYGPRSVELLDRERWAERKPEPPEIPAEPRPQLEPRRAHRAVEPDRGQLADRPPQSPRLRDELDADLETAVGVDAHVLDELTRVRLEGVGGVVGP